jgi:regulator of protease activity HflC (stomatin/prohibitin superfamily)
MTGETLVLLGLILAVIVVLLRTAVVVPQKSAFIVERLGRYANTLGAGFHLLVPFVDRIAYKQNLKEEARDVPPQNCITKDNVAITIDGILYLQVMDPVKASYGISDYRWATTQLAQTTMRSMVGKIELDRTFEERDAINGGVVAAVDKASESWGIKITRYEIKSIELPLSIKEAMEKQMRAEREKRAAIAQSEGERQSQINIAEGERQAAIARSEGEMTRRINEANGEAQAIELKAKAQANAFREIAASLQSPGGAEAMNLRVAQEYIAQFGNLAKAGNTVILPSNLADISGIVASLTQVFGKANR